MKNIALILAGLVLVIAGCASHAPSAQTPKSAAAPAAETPKLTVAVTPPAPDESVDDPDLTTPIIPPFADTEVIRKVYALIRAQHMTTDATDKELYYGAIRGMIEALNDPFSAFLDPKQAKLAHESADGNFVGIGAQLKMEEGHLMIVMPMDDSPAKRAHLKPGDFISKIDDEPTDGMPIDVAVAHIRGVAGTSVKLTILRRGHAGPLEFTLVRRQIDTPSVKWKIERSNGQRLLRITVSEFGNDTPRLFEAAVDEGTRMKVTGLILDLRNDGGGRISSAGFIVCHWIAQKPYVILAPRDKPKDAWMCTNDSAPLAKMRTVVLVNGASASASEITAGALQDYGKARVIGEQTFGKGCGQDVIDFRDGSELRLVSFLWYTPKGRTIHKTGIKPDDIVKGDYDAIEKGHDAQLDRAKQYLTTGK